MKSFVGNSEDVRLTKVTPLLLLGDLDAYRDHQRRQSEAYKKLSDFLAAVEKDDALGTEFISLIWTLESRGILSKTFGILSDDERDEMVRVVRMIKRLVYWH